MQRAAVLETRRRNMFEDVLTLQLILFKNVKETLVCFDLSELMVVFTT